MQMVDRSVQARVHRSPDLFLSHSSRDKEFVRKLAEDLAFCEIDVWLDEWELQVGDSLYDVITKALEKSRYIAVVIGDNFADSRWAGDEMKQALSRERRENRVVVIPLLSGKGAVPAFLEDKLYLDFRRDYFHGLTRLAGMIHSVPRQHIEEAVRVNNPQSIRSSIECLRYVGVEPYVVMSSEDGDAILQAGGQRYADSRIRFSPQEIARNPNVSPRLKQMMLRLIDEVW